MRKIQNGLRSPGGITFSASLVSILIGLVFGLILLLFLNPSFAFYGFGKIVATGVSSSDKFAKVLIIIEGAYSMDGDIASVPEFIKLKKK